METLISISMLNDFIFCPLSIYFHNLYSEVENDLYKDLPQKKGTYAHDSIDTNQYSHAQKILCAINVYSEEYHLYGKIDLYKYETKELIERKKKIKKIYDGYIFQLYAQYFAMKEMDYTVNKLKLYSKDDNKSYSIPLPEENLEMKRRFVQLIHDIDFFDISNYLPSNIEKCRNCIYRNSCDRCLYDEP